ncbi:hypothetical protein NBO_4g0076 [Nosema bombycis CQ1]|uniref:Uncharacterized protein n=1 Tax=Nosema bombycis (strain CQ1 / CVCC 102059) TaxID=578461 RepID=R0MRD5_NOSB1|nr:hypothetical protein NBO_4g0076 [Nosema bombycis CQ1]|eukprot:EOB15448.1 hypothetical protein NBO_4g0076 [Nosema bombycis CQ1]
MKLFGFYTGLIILNFLIKVNAVDDIREVLVGFLRAAVDERSENLAKHEIPIKDVIDKNVHNALMGKNEVCIVFDRAYNLWGKYTPVHPLKECFNELTAWSIVFAIVLGIMLVVDFFAFGYGFFNIMSVSLGLYIFWILQFFFINIPSEYK